MAMTNTFAALCPGCFTDKGSTSICPQCGYDESLKRGPLVLAHRTLLHHGQYLIGRVLGKPGGFGITYLALDTKLETLVAIKEYLPRDLAGREGGQSTISAHSSEDGEFFRFGLTQFLQEARTLAKFDHANIVRVRNFFEENGTGYLVMDYYDGVTLGEYLSQQPQGRLSEKTAIGILMPILDGLREVHAKDFLHRDIKPQNIYLTTDNRAILLDFGAARQAMGERSRSISVVLSEGYAPYEQYHRRGQQGPWVDIYACAAVLYHAVAGEAPPPATERLHKDELDIAGLGVSATLAEALSLALAVDHTKRPQRMTEFQALLLGDSNIGGLDSVEPPQITQEPSQPAESNTDKSRRSQKVWWATALAVVAVVTIAIIGTWNVKEKAAPRSDVAAHTSVPPAPIVATPATVPDDPDTLLWNETKANGTRESFDAYLKQFPNGKYVESANVELKKIAELENQEDLKRGQDEARPGNSIQVPKHVVGDTYVIETVNPEDLKNSSKTERRVVAVETGKIVVESKSLSNKKGAVRILEYTPEWNVIRSRNPDGEGSDFLPPLKYFDFPLFAGKKWQQLCVETNSKTGTKRTHTVNSTVGDWDVVTTPAGTFRAIKINTNTELLDHATGQTITGNDISWYVPELRKSVKSETWSLKPDGSRENRIIQVHAYKIETHEKPEVKNLAIDNNGRKKPQWSIEVIDGEQYLRGIQEGMYGDGKIIFYCKDRKALCFSYYYVGEERAREIASSKWEHSLFVGDQVIPLLETSEFGAGGKAIITIFPLSSDQIMAIASSALVGHGMQMAREAPSFIGYRIDIPTSDSKKVGTFLKKCVIP